MRYPFDELPDDELGRELRLLATAGKSYTLKIRDRQILQVAGDRLRMTPLDHAEAAIEKEKREHGNG
jgi:hypothetical protein